MCYVFFHMPTFLWGKVLCVDTYLWPCIICTSSFVRRNFVVILNFFLWQIRVCRGWEKFAEHCRRQFSFLPIISNWTPYIPESPSMICDLFFTPFMCWTHFMFYFQFEWTVWDLGCYTGNLIEIFLPLCIESMVIHVKLHTSEMIGR
jgi:hypothetical protein